MKEDSRINTVCLEDVSDRVITVKEEKSYFILLNELIQGLIEIGDLLVG